MGWWSDKTVSNDTYATASEYYAELRKGFRDKANHNKLESQLCFCSSIAFTLAAPLFVTLGEGNVWAKVVPAVLSVLAAALASWLQLRQPQRLWLIYRRAQRELEREKSHFDFRLGEYSSASDSEKILAEKVSNIAFRVHEQWEGLVPESEHLFSKKGSISREATNDSA